MVTRRRLRRNGTDDHDILALIAGFQARYPDVARYMPPRVVDGVPGSNRHPEASQVNNSILLFPRFWNLDQPTRDFVLAHETGHYVLQEAGLADYISDARSLGVDVWDTSTLPYSSINMEEAFANVFAEYHIDRDALRSRHPAWIGIVQASIARFVREMTLRR